MRLRAEKIFQNRSVSCATCVPYFDLRLRRLSLGFGRLGLSTLVFEILYSSFQFQFDNLGISPGCQTFEKNTLAKHNENITVLHLSKLKSLSCLQLQSKMRVSPIVTLGNVPGKGLLGYDPSSSVLRHLICKLKRSWKQSVEWRKRGPNYTYDFRSYCLNFSDGPSNDLNQIPPHLG
ncbi:hypothetical protein VNO78_17478 [Psophocarpus tetragonolobus]|uniref:Uncharacterized protein n=1 Tax=Psophocarpus tetragonolobus TaxID=3891 RepID=A0AAN9SHV4_PSOTE